MWNMKRRNDLERMKKLISLASGLNRGSNFLENVESIIEIAQSLEKVNLRSGEGSFLNFLSDESFSDIRARKLISSSSALADAVVAAGVNGLSQQVSAVNRDVQALSVKMRNHE